VMMAEWKGDWDAPNRMYVFYVTYRVWHPPRHVVRVIESNFDGFRKQDRLISNCTVGDFTLNCNEGY
jgi:hypothetical protein